MRRMCLLASIISLVRVEEPLETSSGIGSLSMRLQVTFQISKLSFLFLLILLFVFLAVSSLMELIAEDALHMRTLSATLESIRHRRDANLRELSNALVDLFFTGESDTLIGSVFDTKEEFAAWLQFAEDFVGTEEASTPEGSSRVDLEELTLRVGRVESSPVAGPSSITCRRPSTLSTSSLPPVAIEVLDAQASPNSEEDEDEVLGQLADDSDE